jgi:hypothetical protein
MTFLKLIAIGVLISSATPAYEELNIKSFLATNVNKEDDREAVHVANSETSPPTSNRSDTKAKDLKNNKDQKPEDVTSP